MMLKTLSVLILCLGFAGGITNDSCAHPPFTGSAARCSSKEDCDRTTYQVEFPGNDYQTDIHRLIALRSHPLDELMALANQLEAKWRRINWDHYARVMGYVCSEISNRGLNDARVREQTEHFARVALSHSTMYLWEHEADLVGALGYQRWSANVNVWLRERREKTELWLHAVRRLEKETDPSFDVNDRKNLPSVNLTPPFETGLPSGAPPSAIKDPRLRRQYETAIADNERKAQRVNKQFPLISRGPSFKKEAERWLIQAYSQPPTRNAELKRYLDIYLRDAKTRQRILDEVMKASK